MLQQHPPVTVNLVDNVFSSPHPTLLSLGFAFSNVLQEFAAFQASISSLNPVPCLYFDMSPVSKLPFVLYPHVDHIVRLLIELDSKLRLFLGIAQSSDRPHGDIPHHTTPSSQVDTLRSLRPSIQHALHQIQAHLRLVVSLSNPTNTEYVGRPSSAFCYVGYRWDQFHGLVVDFEDDFINFVKLMDKLLSVRRCLNT
ncbi:hypothetical protein JVT61DRAFT_9134 [Boletus reticuloceps]|uniref:Uncharacterized protein n=1 Tax=Boletus reticuloceps TaxID=495285 RepID=A0A8I2YGR9_9AGAM|nr:hypothetical protein JVT61DRAFT_9134 [Boletus reticuloceps]